MLALAMGAGRECAIHGERERLLRARAPPSSSLVVAHLLPLADVRTQTQPSGPETRAGQPTPTRRARRREPRAQLAREEAHGHSITDPFALRLGAGRRRRASRRQPGRHDRHRPTGCSEQLNNRRSGVREASAANGLGKAAFRHTRWYPSWPQSCMCHSGHACCKR